MVPNFGSYANRKHGRKTSHSPSHSPGNSINASFNPALPDIVNTSTAGIFCPYHGYHILILSLADSIYLVFYPYCFNTLSYTSTAAALAYQQHIYEGELPKYTYGVGGGGLTATFDGVFIAGGTGGGGGAYGADPPGTAIAPTIADMEVDESAWRVGDHMALKSVSLAGFEDDNPGATGTIHPLISLVTPSDHA